MPSTSRPLSEVADIIRSKNAGPFRITLDVLFRDAATFRAVRDSGAITRDSVARAYGIAPPELAKSATCPRCGSTDTEEVSRFGSTPCKAQWRCKDCLEPFDRFKCH